MIVDGNERDPIQPTSIDHSVDEIWADDERKQLEQSYNFLDYHFEKGDLYCRARAYMDEPDCVTLYGPFVERDPTKPASDAGFEADVMSYLRRRFRKVQTLAAMLNDLANVPTPDVP